jgi:hypothetical protein
VVEELYKKFLPDRVWDEEAVHRSDLIYCLRKSWARYTGQGIEHPDKTMMFFLRGRVLHEMLAIGDEEFEVLDSGLTIHVDDVVEGEWLEKKTTNIKYGEPPRMTEAWLLELGIAAAYAPEHKVNMLVLHLMGDYGHNRFPMLSGPWEYEFSEEEVAEALEWVHHRKDVLRQAVGGNIAPGYEYRMAWECKDCPLFGGLCSVDDILATPPNALPKFATEV